MTTRSLRQLAARVSTVLFTLAIAIPAASQEPAPRMVEVDGDTFHVQTAGLQHMERGRPVVVFESGAGTPLTNWRSIFTDVARFAPAVAYDRGGIGRSPWDGEPPTPERRREQLRRLLSELGVSPPYVLVGHSWGGALVRLFAGRHPEEIAGLVYVDPVDYSQTPEEQRSLFREVSPGAGEAAWEEARQAYIELERSFAARAPAGVRAEMDVVLEFMQKEIGERGLGTAPAVPVAVLLGARSRPAPPGVTLPVDWAGLRAAELAQRVRKMGAWVLDAPDGLFAVARHAGHFVHQDDAELVVDAIRRVVFPDVGWQLASTLSDGGATALAETYGTLKRRYPADRFHENLLNTLGYDLLRAGRVEDAIAVFELNVEEYPAAWNPHDSLGDAYRAAGRTAEAMASYRRSLELNPNSPSRRKLETLEPGG